MKDKLPIGWEWNKLGNIAEYINGSAFKPSDWNNSIGLPIIRIQNLNGNNSYNYFDGDVKEKYLVENGDILISWSASLDVYKWNNGKAILNQHIFNTKINRKIVDENFFYLLIKFALDEIKSQVHGVGMQHITKGKFEKIVIPFPPISEQKQIVSVLDKTFEKLDKAIILVKENIQKLKQLNESVLGDVFNSLLLKKRLVKLETLGNISAGGTPLRSKRNYWNGNINWFTSGELNDKYVYNSKECITQNGFENSNTKLFPKGTLLVGMYDTAAFKMSILTEDATCNQAIVGIKPNDSFISEYLYYQLTFLRPLVLNLRQGVRQQNLNASKIKNIDIYLPNISEQQRIVVYLDQTTDKNNQLIQYYQNKLQSLKELKNSILDSAFKGELRRSRIIPISKPIIDPFFAKTKNWNAKKNADKQAMIIALAMEAHEKMGKSLYRTKGEKTVEIIEKHIDLEFGREAKKMAAGPASFEHLVKVVEPLAKEKKWFDIQEIKGGNYDSHKYIKAENFNPFLMRCVMDLKSNLNEIRRVVNLFVNMKTTHEAEVVATTYTGWNNLIIRAAQINEEAIVTEARENWHDAKLKIERQEFFEAISWLKENNLVPKGNGKEVL
jgi:type I restriction enzyme S subunit